MGYLYEKMQKENNEIIKYLTNEKFNTLKFELEDNSNSKFILLDDLGKEIPLDETIFKLNTNNTQNKIQNENININQENQEEPKTKKRSSSTINIDDFDQKTKNNELYKIKKQEIMNITQKISTSKQKKQDEERNKSKKIIKQKKIYHISKNVKSQRPSNITNISNKINLNLKINPKKYLQQKMNKYEKLISLKEPRKMKSAMNNNNNFDLNINKFSNYTPQIKSILNSFNSKKKEKENINYFNHLNTEENKINTNMKKNY